MVVSNSGPIMWLSKVGLFGLLRALFGHVVIPPEVYEETVTRGAGHPNAVNVIAACADGWLTVASPVDTGSVAALAAHLHLAEAQALAMAQELQTTVLVDELRGRHLAEAMGLEVIGTAGILLRAYEKGMPVDVLAALDAMRGSGFRLSDAVYNRIADSLLPNVDP